MNSDIRAAFGHPIERSEATMPEGMLDRISLRDHIVEVEIGAFQSERDVTQRVSFNVVVEVQPLTADAQDDVDRILSYDRVTEAIAHELAAERLNLLETLAERIATRILREPQAMRVFVRIEKLDRGPGALGVEIVRAREGDAAGQEAEPQLHPRLLYLSNAAIATDHLATWLDQLAALGAPLLLVVGQPETAALQVGSERAQRRIDLLAIEQNAWQLSARDPRCVVVNTRTELDWAMKHGQISVWAPSKMVLDALSAAPQGVEGPELALWLGQQLAAVELISIGTPLPAAGALPTREVSLDSVQI